MVKRYNHLEYRRTPRITPWLGFSFAFEIIKFNGIIIIITTGLHMTVKMKKKEIVENINNLKSENKSLALENIAFYFLCVPIIITSYIFYKSNSFDIPVILLLLAPMAIIMSNKRLIEKNEWAIETLNKIIGVEIEDKKLVEENMHSNAN